MSYGADPGESHIVQSQNNQTHLILHPRKVQNSANRRDGAVASLRRWPPLTSATPRSLLRCGLCRIGSPLELGRCDLAIAIPVIAGEQWIRLSDKFFAAEATVSVVVEVSKLGLFENGTGLLDGLEFCGIDIAIAIVIGQVEDSGRVLLPLIARVGAVVVQIPQVRRGYDGVVLGDILRINRANGGVNDQDSREPIPKAIRHLQHLLTLSSS
jgi:hypothetical protein